jgi:hypothetical protein
MKKIIIILAVVLIPNIAVYAETATQTQPLPTRQNILRERIEKQRTSYMQNLQEAREIAEQYRTATTPEERNELRKKARQGFVIRLTNAVERLTLMQDQTEERINLAESKGFDVSSARTKLTESRNYLAITLEKKEELKTKLENEEAIEKEEVKEIFEIIKENFHLSRLSLIESIKILKTTVIDSLQDSSDETEEVTEEDN